MIKLRHLMTHIGVNKPKTLGVIVIGNEILNGKVADINTKIICRAAPALDDLITIAAEVKLFKNEFDYVITSGGIGSTHDDLTFESVAKALNEQTYYHPELLRIVANLSSNNTSVQDSTNPKAKLAKIPESSELIYDSDHRTGRKSLYPVIKANNIYMLPGIPSLFNVAFEIIKDRLRDVSIKFSCRTLYLNEDETVIAPFLFKLADKFADVVDIGSYPIMNNNYYRVSVTFDGLDESKLLEAYDQVKTEFHSKIVAYKPDPISRAVEEVLELGKQTDSELGQCVNESLRIIEEAFDKFQPSELLVGFNGGKDCTVLLHLVYVVLRRRGLSMDQLPNLLYIRSYLVFPEVEIFIKKTLLLYGLTPDVLNDSMSVDNGSSKFLIYDGDIKRALTKLLTDDPGLKGVFMGTRSTDPKAGNLKPMIMTDPGWPQVYRINPLLNWTYKTVWEFLRTLSLPYCSLYDVGYTSIGSMEDTYPNPKLRYVTETGRVGYYPAYMLTDENMERFCRQPKKN